jgi:hypothetical protein
MESENARAEARCRAQHDDHQDKRAVIRRVRQISQRTRYMNVRRPTSEMSASGISIRMRQVGAVGKGSKKDSAIPYRWIGVFARTL